MDTKRFFIGFSILRPIVSSARHVTAKMIVFFAYIFFVYSANVAIAPATKPRYAPRENVNMSAIIIIAEASRKSVFLFDVNVFVIAHGSASPR